MAAAFRGGLSTEEAALGCSVTIESQNELEWTMKGHLVPLPCERMGTPTRHVLRAPS